MVVLVTTMMMVSIAQIVKIVNLAYPTTIMVLKSPSNMISHVQCTVSGLISGLNPCTAVAYSLPASNLFGVFCFILFYLILYYIDCNLLFLLLSVDTNIIIVICVVIGLLLIVFIIALCKYMEMRRKEGKQPVSRAYYFLSVSCHVLSFSNP